MTPNFLKELNDCFIELDFYSDDNLIDVYHLSVFVEIIRISNILIEINYDLCTIEHVIGHYSKGIDIIFKDVFQQQGEDSVESFNHIIIFYESYVNFVSSFRKYFLYPFLFLCQDIAFFLLSNLYKIYKLSFSSFKKFMKKDSFRYDLFLKIQSYYINLKSYDFSFSNLKSIINTWLEKDFDPNNLLFLPILSNLFLSIVDFIKRKLKG